MSYSYARSPTCDDAVAEFESWQRSVQLSGVSGRHGDSATFLPYDLLETYLNEDRIHIWLRAVYGQDRAGANLRTIASEIIDKGCVRVFAILFVIRCGYLIRHVLAHALDLGDESLPFRKTQRPADFPGEPDVFHDFCSIQYQYCVRPLKNLNISFLIDRILPIKSMTKIGSGNSAQAYKAELHDGYNSIQSRPDKVRRRGQQHSNTFVLKKYRHINAEARADFRRECTAFATLNHDAADLNIVGYFGYITVEDHPGQQSEHCANYLVLEYADCGNLEEFWQSFHHPASAAASWAYWEQIFGLAKALNRIQFVTSDTSDDDGTALRGFHHDIRPRNILVTRDYTNLDSPFPYQFLVGDLGEATFVRTKHNTQSASTEDPRSSQIYRAPELTRTPWQPRWSLGVAQSADVWSLGAVFSEALVWSTLGYRWVELYREEREKQSNGNGPCFHNGASVLDAVVQQHQTCEEGARKGEKLIGKIVSFVEDDLLVPADQRSTSSQLVTKTNGILTRTKQPPPPEMKTTPETLFPSIQSPGPSIRSLSIDESQKSSRQNTWLPLSPETPDSRPFRQSVGSKTSMPHSPGNRHNRRFSTSSSASQNGHASRDENARPEELEVERPPYVSIAQLKEWKAGKKIGISSPAFLKSIERLRELENRDSVFIIDDSESMRNHWTTVKDLLSLLAWTVKKFDDNGMDYYFLSEMKKRNSKTATSIVEQTQLRAGHPAVRLNAATCLDKIFGDYASRYQSKQGSIRSKISAKFYGPKPDGRICKPCSYFILTDAIWQPKCKVSAPIIRLMDSLRDARDHQVGISFIQFGNDDVGTRRLRFLDDSLKDRYNIPDIIDYEPANGNVLKMLLGSINKWWDDDNDVKGNEAEGGLDE